MKKKQIKPIYFRNIIDYNNKSRPRSKENKDNKRNTLDSTDTLCESREVTPNAFRKGIFPTKEKKGKGIEILAPKQMLQRLPITLALVKLGNTSENLLYEIRQIIYSLYGGKKSLKSI